MIYLIIQLVLTFLQLLISATNRFPLTLFNHQEIICFQCFITTFIIDRFPHSNLFISSLSPRDGKFTEWRSIESEGDSFSLDHGNRISCFDSESPIRGELRFVVLTEKFSKVEQRKAGKRIARNKLTRRFPLPAIWICRKGSLLFIF